MATIDGKIIIALDAMGGDNAPDSVLKGADLFLKKNGKKKNVSFLLYGKEGKLTPILSSCPHLTNNSTICHTDSVVNADEKPSIALRKGKKSSMRLAIDAAKEGEAHAVISAGNTGALMAMSKLSMRTLPFIDRPAITSVFPTRRGKCVFLDLGANIDCNSENLVQFAIMGNAFAKVLLGIDKPKVGLLNVGAEDNKGSEVVKSAAEELKEGGYPINYYGYVEGNDLAEGVVDVVVTDGFTGNIALKTAEGTAKICSDYIKEAFRSSPFAMLGGILAKSALKRTFKKMDPKLHNGAMFLGLNGITVKSHGGADAISYANAISVAYELAANQINDKISDELSEYDESLIENEFDSLGV